MPNAEKDPLFDLFKSFERTPGQSHYDSIDHRLLELEDHIEDQRPKRAKKTFLANGGREADWGEDSGRQAWEMAFHHSDDDEGRTLLDVAREALADLESRYKAGAIMIEELTEAEVLARSLAEHLGVDYDGIFPD